jgi:hypothetical protein
MPIDWNSLNSFLVKGVKDRSVKNVTVLLHDSFNLVRELTGEKRKSKNPP